MGCTAHAQVQKELETPLARGLVAGEFCDGDTIEVDADSDKVSLRIRVLERRSDDVGEAGGKGFVTPTAQNSPSVPGKAVE